MFKMYCMKETAQFRTNTMSRSIRKEKKREREKRRKESGGKRGCEEREG